MPILSSFKYIFLFAYGSLRNLSSTEKRQNQKWAPAAFFHLFPRGSECQYTVTTPFLHIVRRNGHTILSFGNEYRLVNWSTVKLSRRHAVNPSIHGSVKPSICECVSLSVCQSVNSSSRQAVKPSSRQAVNPSPTVYIPQAKCLPSLLCPHSLNRETLSPTRRLYTTPSISINVPIYPFTKGRINIFCS